MAKLLSWFSRISVSFSCRLDDDIHFKAPLAALCIQVTWLRLEAEICWLLTRLYIIKEDSLLDFDFDINAFWLHFWTRKIKNDTVKKKRKERKSVCSLPNKWFTSTKSASVFISKVSIQPVRPQTTYTRQWQSFPEALVDAMLPNLQAFTYRPCVVCNDKSIAELQKKIQKFRRKAEPKRGCRLREDNWSRLKWNIMLYQS